MLMVRMRGGIALFALALSVAGCGGAQTAAPTPSDTPTEAASATPAGPDYSALLKAGDRPVADVGDDAHRKPAEVLAFSKIMPGQTVFEIEAGSGYYTELISHAVGPDGKVIMQSPAFGGFYDKEIAARLKDNRLPNVTRSTSNFDKLDAPDDSVDVVLWFLGPHELFFTPQDNPKGFGDAAKSFQEVKRILKPGGYFVVMDHNANTGEPPEETANKLHRIDRLRLMSMATSATFVLEEESQLLRNTTDDHTLNVFDDKIRRKTDQVLLRYQKLSGT